MPTSSCAIEQGPPEAEGALRGAVTGVQGISWQELTITSQSNHAGTTPMSLRHDATQRRIATFVRELALDPRPPAGRHGRFAHAAPEPRERRRRDRHDDRRSARTDEQIP